MVDQEELMKKIAEIDAFVRKLDPAVRASAFDRLMGTLGSTAKVPGAPAVRRGGPNDSEQDDAARQAFFGKFDNSKPSDNVLLIAAWLYSLHGIFAIERSDIESVAGEVGLVVPTRPDMTMEGAAKGGKALFQKVEGGFKPTVSAQLLFREKYQVAAGRRPRSKPQLT